MNPSKMSPVEIDTKLVELYAATDKARRSLTGIKSSLSKAAANKSKGHPCYTPYDDDDVEEASSVFVKAIAAEMPYEAQYAHHPWTRYYHVTNVTGHIHHSRDCSSCNYSTQYAWRTDLSGLSDVEVVAREAHNACSVCMPIAPVEQRAARERYNAEQRAAKAAERASKAAAKAAKAQQRAIKHVDKVEAEIAKMGGFEAFRYAYSLHGHNGGRSIYAWSNSCPTMVGDTLYEMKQRQEEGRSYHSLNEHVKAELTKRGLR